MHIGLTSIPSSAAMHFANTAPSHFTALCRCVEVPADCGTAVGKACCPSSGHMVTDKALPTAAWGGNVCNPAAGEHGTYCDGEGRALEGVLANALAAANRNDLACVCDPAAGEHVT